MNHYAQDSLNVFKEQKQLQKRDRAQGRTIHQLLKKMGKNQKNLRKNTASATTDNTSNIKKIMNILDVINLPSLIEFHKAQELSLILTR